MRAVVIGGPGGPEVLELRDDVPDPEPGPGEVRVRVAATAVNRADVLQRRGGYPAPAGSSPNISGLEYAGVVDAVGPATSRWPVGARVMGLVGGGGYAEYVVVREDEAVAVPEGLDLTGAAAVPEVFMTAHDALFTQAGLAAGQVVLVHAAGSGVGTAAIQLSKAAGVRVIGTSRSAWKLERALQLGLDVAVDVSGEDFVEVVQRETGGRGCDVVLDLVGGDYLAGNMRASASQAKIMVVGLVAGATTQIDMRMLMSRRLTLRGTVMRARTATEKAEVARAFERDVLPLFAEGRIAPVIDRVMDAADAARAHALIETNQTFGKIVLAWSG